TNSPATPGTTATPTPPPPPPTGPVTVIDGPASPLAVQSTVAGSPVAVCNTNVVNATTNAKTSALAITVDGQTTYRTPTSVSSLDVKPTPRTAAANKGQSRAPVPNAAAPAALATSPAPPDWPITAAGTATVGGAGI